MLMMQDDYPPNCPVIELPVRLYDFMFFFVLSQCHDKTDQSSKATNEFFGLGQVN